MPPRIRAEVTYGTQFHIELGRCSASLQSGVSRMKSLNDASWERQYDFEVAFPCLDGSNRDWVRGRGEEIRLCVDKGIQVNIALDFDAEEFVDALERAVDDSDESLITTWVSLPNSESEVRAEVRVYRKKMPYGLRVVIEIPWSKQQLTRTNVFARLSTRKVNEIISAYRQQ